MKSVLMIIEGKYDSLQVAKFANSIVVDSLKAALSILDSDKHIDIIITDTELKDSRGTDTIKSIREVFDGILIASVNCNNYRVGIAAVKTGADDFILHEDLNSKYITNLIKLCQARRGFKSNLIRAKQLSAILPIPLI